MRAAQDDPAAAVALVGLAPDPAEFYRPQHETLMAQMRKAVDEGEPLDGAAMLGRLRDAGELRQDSLDGAKLLELEQRGVPPASVPYHAERVRCLAKHRRAIIAADRARQRLTR